MSNTKLVMWSDMPDVPVHLKVVCVMNGSTFFPMGIFGEVGDDVRSSRDGYDVVTSASGHRYIDSRWLAFKYPKHREMILEIAMLAMDVVAKPAGMVT
jgi:hypothetical protein